MPVDQSYELSCRSAGFDTGYRLDADRGVYLEKSAVLVPIIL